MKKTNKKQIPKVRMPKYSTGGKFGKGLKDTGLFLADTALAEWAPNAISQDQYSDSPYGKNLGKVASIHESFDSQSPIRKNVSKYWTDNKSSGMDEEEQSLFNKVQPIAKTGSKIGEMWTGAALGGIGKGAGSKATGFGKNLGKFSEMGTKDYNPNVYNENQVQNQAQIESQNQTAMSGLNDARRNSMTPNGNMYAKYGGYMKFGMGGMKPNAEVENNEMITSDTPPQVFNNGGVELASNNPYGTPTYKTNGASHENGGIPMNMAPGSIINGKTKNPLTGNKFTKDVDIIAKMENKYTKKAENGDRYSNTNAKLILPILAQKKDYLNNLQNAIIANNEQRKALNRGELPQPSMDNEQMEPQGQSEQSEGEYKYGGIHINPANKGKFTASAQRAGMGTQEFASHVLANKEDYSSTQVKRANFAHNAAGWKHEMGGMQPYAMGGESEYGGPNDPKPFNVKDPIVKAAIARNLTENPLVRDYSYELKTGGKKGDELFATDSSGKKTKINFQDLNTGEYNPAYNDTVRAAIKIKIKDSLQKHALGGVQLPYYNTDRNGNPKYGMGGFNDGEPLNEQGLTKPQYQQAQTDSMTLYKSGLGKKENWNYPGFNDAQLRLTNPKTGETPKSLSGKEVTSTGAINNFSGVQQYQKPSMTPWKEYIPEVPKAGVSILNKTKNDSLHPVYDQYIPGIEKSKQKGIVLQYSNGGKMPKFGGGGRFINGVWVDDSETAMQDAGDTADYYDNAAEEKAKQNAYTTGMNNAINDPYRRNSFVAPTDPYSNPDAFNRRAEREARDASEMNGTKKSLMNNIDWSKTDKLGNLFNFIGQNVGNIYDLTRKNEPLQKYERTTGKYITPDFRDANQKYLWAKQALGNASGGSAGAFLANIQKAHVDNVMNRAQIQQTADNTNAQIGNQVNQFNTEIAYREAEARAKDAAMKENVRSQAIASLGSSFGKATKSGKQDNIDQDTLKMFQWRYKNEPGFKKYIDNFSTEKDSKEAVA